MKNYWIKLPKELVNIILEYNGSIKYRNGKYMNKISHNDSRYNLLLTIPQKKYVSCYGTRVILCDIKYKFKKFTVYNCSNYYYSPHYVIYSYSYTNECNDLVDESYLLY